MKKKMKYVIPAALAAIALVAVMPHTAKAQADPGWRIYLYENGAKVGEIFVPARASGQAAYDEEWVLYPNYLYPGPNFIGALQVLASPSETPYASAEDFFRKVPFVKGSKYIHVTAQESTVLPGGRAAAEIVGGSNLTTAGTPNPVGPGQEKGK